MDTALAAPDDFLPEGAPEPARDSYAAASRSAVLLFTREA